MNPLYEVLVKKGFVHIGGNIFIVSDSMLLSAVKKIREENKVGGECL